LVSCLAFCLCILLVFAYGLDPQEVMASRARVANSTETCLFI